MLKYPDIDPVMIHIGPLQVRWYGMMYVLGFFAAWFLVRRQIRERHLGWLAGHFENLNGVLLLCLIAGGRLGYVLFYNPGWYLGHPLEIFATWKGGMSFHGALIGIIVGGLLYCRRHRLDFLATADVYVVPVPIGLGLGRLGNFINGELYGRITDVPWAMVFPGGGPWPRHPSQLYESFGEGVLLFGLLWMCRNRIRGRGGMLALFLAGYGVVRFTVEFFREPDPQLGYLFSFITMGQLLSLLMIGAALALFLSGRRRQEQQWVDKKAEKRHKDERL